MNNFFLSEVEKEADSSKQLADLGREFNEVVGRVERESGKLLLGLARKKAFVAFQEHRDIFVELVEEALQPGRAACPDGARRRPPARG